MGCIQIKDVMVFKEDILGSIFLREALCLGIKGQLALRK
jgi:hypothetical protein